MKNAFFSLTPHPPDGFTHITPTRRDLLSSRVALFTDSLDAAFELLDGFPERVQGVVITIEDVFSHSSIGPGLWHLTVTEDMLPNLREKAACVLDMMALGQKALDENMSLKIELARSKKTQKHTRQSYNENIERLRKRIADLHNEIERRKRAEKARLVLERQVQHAQKLESLGVLAGGIAHDFNNLLMGILGNADLALDELSPMSPARGNIEEIEHASKRAAELAKQMLAYSGRGQFVTELIDAGKLLEEMGHLLEVSISKKVALKYHFAENLPAFDGDVTQIRQIIMNLITNASEAIGDSSGVIALSTGAMDCDRVYLDSVSAVLHSGIDDPLPEGVYVYFEVTDTGCGMDDETIERIFDPFFTTKFTGRGLGMSAVLGIVRGHKGTIKVNSEVGKGTTFKVLFPANIQTDGDIAMRRKDRTVLKDWRGTGTVLIADDEEMVRTVGRLMLERLGFSVLTASDGSEALEVFRAHADEIVCVLLDLTMPHMNGEESFRAMQHLHADVTVLLCSGYNEQEATQHFAGKGLAGFIQKPYTMAVLKEKLMEILRDGPDT